MFPTPPTQPANPVPPQLIEGIEAVYVHEKCGDESICVYFTPIKGAKITRYAIYRSMIGFVAPLPELSVLDGKTLEIAINDGPTQTITFNGTTPVVDMINAAVTGAIALYSKADANKFLFRVDPAEEGEDAPVLKILGGTALADLGLTVRDITEKSEDVLLAYVPFRASDVKSGVEYCDPDGTIHDFYRVSTINNANEESIKSAYFSPMATLGKICCLFGIVTDITGRRVVDAEVTAEVVEYPQSVADDAFINQEPITTLTTVQGRFELCLLQGALVELSIPAIGYHRKIRVPAESRASITELLVDRDYRYPLEP